MEKHTKKIRINQNPLAPESAILDIEADGFYWRTSPLIRLSVIRAADANARPEGGLSLPPANDSTRQLSSAHDETRAARPEGSDTAFYFDETVLLSEKESDEYDMLAALPQLLKGISEVITFNGNAFDIPFLRGKCKAYGLAEPFSGIKTRDLFPEYRPLAYLLGLPARKLSDYADYIDAHQAAASHRTAVEDDAQRTLEILGFDCLLKLPRETFVLKSAGIKGDVLAMTLDTITPSPCRISLHDEPFHFIFEANEIRLSSRIYGGNVRFYHSDIKNYYYLPQEGFAIYKTMGDFVDPSHREKATRETCFTCLRLTGSFLKNEDQLLTYAASALTYLLQL